MGRIIKLVLGNLAIFFLIVLFGNLLVGAYYDISDWWSAQRVKHDRRVELPNFVDKERSQLVFTENRMLETGYRPFIAWSRRAFSGETVNVNAAGDRIHDAPGSGARGHVRFFGGSTTWGTGVDDDHTIPALFNDLNPDWTVHNHGESGFVSRQELARLINLVHSGAPTDLVIFYDGYNDVRNLCRPGVDLTGHNRQGQLAALVEPVSLFWTALTNGLDLLVQKLRKNAGRLRYPPSRCMENEAYGEEISKMVLANWRTAREVARIAGADFLAFLQPAAAYGSPNLSHLADDAFSLDDYSQLHTNKLGRGVDHKIVYPQLRRAIEAERADWIHDLTDAFDGDEYIYMGPAHVTGNGNAIIAERITRVAAPVLEARVDRSAVEGEKEGS